MGAYSPSNIITNKVEEKIKKEIIDKILQELFTNKKKVEMNKLSFDDCNQIILANPNVSEIKIKIY